MAITSVAHKTGSLLVPVDRYVHAIAYEGVLAAARLVFVIDKVRGVVCGLRELFTCISVLGVCH